MDITKIKVDIPQSIEELSLDQINFDYNILVSTSNNDDFKELFIEGKETLPHRTWLIYKTLQDWVSHDFDEDSEFIKEIKKDIGDIFPCQTAFCTCFGSDEEIILSKDDLIAQRITQIREFRTFFEEKLNEQLELLNNRFNDEPLINCSLEIHDYFFDIDINSYQRCISYNDPNFSRKDCEGTLFLRRDNPDIWFDWRDKITDEEIDIIKVRTDRDILGFEPGKRETLSCPEAKDEYLSINPKFYSSIKLTCEDKSTIISLGNEIKNFEATIGLKFALNKGCDTVSPLNLDTEPEEPRYCEIEPNGDGPWPENGTEPPEVPGGGATDCKQNCINDGQYNNNFDPSVCQRFNCDTCSYINISCAGPGECGGEPTCWFDGRTNAYCRRPLLRSECDDGISCTANFCRTTSVRVDGGIHYDSYYCAAIDTCISTSIRNVNNCGQQTCNTELNMCVGDTLDCTLVENNPGLKNNNCKEPVCVNGQCNTRDKICGQGEICNPDDGKCIPFGPV